MRDDENDPAPDEFDDPEADAGDEDDFENDPSRNPPEELDRLRGA